MKRAASLLSAMLVTLLAASAAAEPTPLDVQANHANGTTLIVRGIEIGEATIRLDLTVITADRNIELSNNDSMVLTDDGGRQYRLVPPPDNRDVQVPARSRLTGEMIFGGRLNPAARRLVLTTNEGSGGGSGRYETFPLFRIEIPVPGRVEEDQPAAADSAAPPASQAQATAQPSDAGPAPAGGALPRQIRVDAQASHPNGSTLIIDALELTEDGILVTLRISTGDREIKLNQHGSLQLIDDRGARHQAVPPADNPDLLLPPHSNVEARIFFTGRLSPEATRVTLTSNDGVGGSESNPYDRTPVFRISVPLEG